MSKTTDQQAKDTGAAIASYFREEATHLRAGTWNGLDGAEVTFLGTVADLHRTACTCCPRKAPA